MKHHYIPNKPYESCAIIRHDEMTIISIIMCPLILNVPAVYVQKGKKRNAPIMPPVPSQSAFAALSNHAATSVPTISKAKTTSILNNNTTMRKHGAHKDGVGTTDTAVVTGTNAVDGAFTDELCCTSSTVASHIISTQHTNAAISVPHTAVTTSAMALNTKKNNKSKSTKSSTSNSTKYEEADH